VRELGRRLLLCDTSVVDLEQVTQNRGSNAGTKGTHKDVDASGLLLLDLLRDAEDVVAGGEITSNSDDSLSTSRQTQKTYSRDDLANLSILVCGSLEDLLTSAGDIHGRAIRNKRLGNLEAT
jgi:hypothetical protein